MQNSESIIVSLVKQNGGLNYFTISEDYVVEAEYIELHDSKEIEMKTRSEKFNTAYIPHALLRFNLFGEQYELFAYRDAEPDEDIFIIGDDGELQENEPGELEWLFLPFTDLTSGDTSYGGGRYMEIELEAIRKDKITLDFNLCYNPGCAYFDNMLCPIPPPENFLNLKLEAGSKKFDH